MKDTKTNTTPVLNGLVKILLGAILIFFILCMFANIFLAIGILKVLFEKMF